MAYAVKNLTTGELLPDRFDNRAMANVLKNMEAQSAAMQSTTLLDIPKFKVVQVKDEPEPEPEPLTPEQEEQVDEGYRLTADPYEYDYNG